jgi:hypothetical protein
LLKVCYELPLAVNACRNVRKAKATRCNPASVPGKRS